MRYLLTTNETNILVVPFSYERFYQLRGWKLIANGTKDMMEDLKAIYKDMKND